MSLVYEGYDQTPDVCKNHNKELRTNEIYGTAYRNSTEKKLPMKPCPECYYCANFIFAGSDSGGTTFCYNFEEKERCQMSHRNPISGLRTLLGSLMGKGRVKVTDTGEKAKYD